MGLKYKVDQARELIGKALSLYKRPVIFWSSGKDSMVLLHLFLGQSGTVNFPVVFHREPFMPWKYAFANRVIEQWGLTVYDYPPSGTAVQQANGHVEILSYYRAGGCSNALPAGIVEPDFSRPYLCGYRDLLLKPLGDFQFPWDVAFIGHKSSDVDPILGAVPLKVDVRQNPGGCDLAFPLRHFTDADVWEYTEQFGLPVHEGRYEKRDGTWGEKADKHDNPDYFPVCVRCMDANGPDRVFCPKLGLEVDSIKDRVNRVAAQPLSYFGKD